MRKTYRVSQAGCNISRLPFFDFSCCKEISLIFSNFQMITMSNFQIFYFPVETRKACKKVSYFNIYLQSYVGFVQQTIHTGIQLIQ